MNYTVEEKEFFMREALKEAEIALDHDEIPIGCVIVKDGKIIGRGHNAREELQRAVMHAEVMAIEKANQHEHSWRLLDTTLFVTIEPCVMCSGAIGLARIPQVIYGAKNPKFGAAGSLYDILTDERLNHRVELESGILEAECAQMMQDFLGRGDKNETLAKCFVLSFNIAVYWVADRQCRISSLGFYTSSKPAILVYPPDSHFTDYLFLLSKEPSWNFC